MLASQKILYQIWCGVPTIDLNLVALQLAPPEVWSWISKGQPSLKEERTGY